MWPALLQRYVKRALLAVVVVAVMVVLHVAHEQASEYSDLAVRVETRRDVSSTSMETLGGMKVRLYTESASRPQSTFGTDMLYRSDQPDVEAKAHTLGTEQSALPKPDHQLGVLENSRDTESHVSIQKDGEGKLRTALNLRTDSAMDNWVSSRLGIKLDDMVKDSHSKRITDVLGKDKSWISHRQTFAPVPNNSDRVSPSMVKTKRSRLGGNRRILKSPGMYMKPKKQAGKKGLYAPGKLTLDQNDWKHQPIQRENMSQWREYAKRHPRLKYNPKFQGIRELFCDGISTVECSNKSGRVLSSFERSGNNIMFTLRTTLLYHQKRLPQLLQTWISVINSSNVFIVTDGHDQELEDLARKRGIHYSISPSVGTYNQADMCCKAGHEMSLMFLPENEHYDWHCHVDDDVYVILPTLVNSLSKFDPRKEAVYFGRAVQSNMTGKIGGISYTNFTFQFAPGCMYCLSRPLLLKARELLVGCNAFRKSCNATDQPEDVTVALALGVALNSFLNATELIYPHSLDLTFAVPSAAFSEQIAITYGFGQTGNWKAWSPNVIMVKDAIFGFDDDPSQFKSLHCHLHSETDWCVQRMREIDESNIEWVDPWRAFYRNLRKNETEMERLRKHFTQHLL